VDESQNEENGYSKKEWGGIPDLLKKAMVAGAGALFMTEEGIRSVMGESKLTKEMINYIVTQVSKTKEDFFNIVSKEIRGFLESGLIAEQIRNALTKTSLEITTKVKFVTEDDKLKPVSDSKIKVRHADKKRKK
jgi:hypothetical protein